MTIGEILRCDPSGTLTDPGLRFPNSALISGVIDRLDAILKRLTKQGLVFKEFSFCNLTLGRDPV
jgi:hypothetical protein